MDESWKLEVAPEIETYVLGGRSLADWHDFLTTDHYTGQPNGHLSVPRSRYGLDGNEAAWWAIAAQASYSYATGQDEDIAQSMDYFMSLAVNDDPSLIPLIRDFHWVIPDELYGKLDFEAADPSHI